MASSNSCIERYENSGGGERRDGFLGKVVGQVVGGVCAKVAADRAMAALETAPPSPVGYEKAAGLLGWLLVTAGMMKFGGVAMAFAVLVPMVAVVPELPPAMVSALEVLAAAIVVLTAALA